MKNRSVWIIWEKIPKLGFEMHTNTLRWAYWQNDRGNRFKGCEDGHLVSVKIRGEFSTQFIFNAALFNYVAYFVDWFQRLMCQQCQAIVVTAYESPNMKIPPPVLKNKVFKLIFMLFLKKVASLPFTLICPFS